MPTGVHVFVALVGIGMNVLACKPYFLPFFFC